MADEESASRTHSETLDTRLTPETMDKVTAYREANGLSETAAARRLIRAELSRDRQAERKGVLQLTVGFGSLLLSLYWFVSTDAFVAGTAVYMALILIWTRYPAIAQRF